MTYPNANANVARTGGFLPLVILAFLAFLPEVAAAAPWDGAANQVLEIFTGGLTRTLAIIAVIACGIAAIAGKLSWDWAIKIIVGIVLIFGSTAVVDYIISAAGS
ncbi:MAG: TrbC/VirB2 family protein [Azoarcus sp.]|jgi:type IV secretion system protein VirB2|nr:TrbC/VirB2 family protein [Azoarcus sp.]